MSRKIKQNVKVLVEGFTEKYYISGLKSNTTTVLNIQPPVNMDGGGYTNFIREVKKLDYKACVAIFIIIDLDNAETDKDNLYKLINLCNQKTSSTKIPYILIGTNKDFEYFACCHSNSYKNTDTTAYILKNFKYKTITEFKSDSKVYTKLNTTPCNYTNALNKIKIEYNNNNTFFKNKYTSINNGANISIKIKPTLNADALSLKHSNLIEFFEIIGLA